jgi:hypothetical protein
MHRRRFLAGANVPRIAVGIGWLDSSAGRGPSGTATPPGTDRTDTGVGTPDPTDRTIDGRLHNETDVIQSFDVIVRDSDGFRITSGEYRVAPHATDRVPAVGRPGATQLFDVTVDGSRFDGTEDRTGGVERPVAVEPLVLEVSARAGGSVSTAPVSAARRHGSGTL